MRLGDVGNLFVTVGLLAVTVVFIVFLLGYFIIYKRFMKGKKQLSLWKLVLWGGFLSYILIVLGATLVVRQTFYSGSRFNFQLFSQYRFAWHNFCVAEWRNIILNIMMFVPFGVMLPRLVKRLRMIWKTIFICFAGSVFIEITQLITGRGIFAFDDIFHNTLGGFIGYGLFCSAFAIVSVRPLHVKKIVVGFIPLLITTATFIGIFVTYDLQEFGNMSQRYVNRVNMEGIILSSEVALSSEPTQAMVYTTSGVASVAEVKMLADEFFAMLEAEIDETHTQIYNDAVFFEALSPNGQMLTLAINYRAMTYRFFDFSSFDHNRVSADEELIRERLKGFGIYIPETAIFSEEDDGVYHFESIPESDGALTFWGWLGCVYYDDGTIKEINNHLVEVHPVRMVDIINKQQAYEQIEKGMFQHDSSIEIRSLHVISVRLTYEMDTKGFLQPVYSFEVEIDGYEQNIIIPAI